MARDGSSAVKAFDRIAPVERESTASIVATRIRDAVIDGSFGPGMQLSEAQLADRLGISRGPVREAMQRLIQEGLLRAERHRGVFVIELGPDDVRDVYLARATTERTAVSLLLRRGDRRAIAELEALVDELEAASRSGEWSRVADLDLAFHERLVAATGSKRLIRMFRTLMAETRMCLTGLESGYAVWEDLADEHKAIVAAMHAADEERALALLDAHFESALRDLGAAG